MITNTYCKNFEKAISLTTGDLVFPADQDDFWMPSKVGGDCTFFEKIQTARWYLQMVS